jgi:hypothetical protein
MKITAITEHDDGSATFDFDLDDTTAALTQELGLKLLIYCGATGTTLDYVFNTILERTEHDNILPMTRNEELIAENERLLKALGVYDRERDRFKHASADVTGLYFLAGGHGEVDENLLPKFVHICPAYGCAWEQVYVKTDKTVNYEGS